MSKSSSEYTDTLIQLTKQGLAIQLYLNGVTMDGICENLHLSKKTVVEMLKGIKKVK